MESFKSKSLRKLFAANHGTPKCRELPVETLAPLRNSAALLSHPRSGTLAVDWSIGGTHLRLYWNWAWGWTRIKHKYPEEQPYKTFMITQFSKSGEEVENVFDIENSGDSGTPVTHYYCAPFG
ncbi:hypothetical protein EMPG_10440, partial [Blastomyces silverae]